MNSFHPPNPGTADSLDTSRLYPLVYDELRRLAASLLAGERKDGASPLTLQPTALVNEVYLRFSKTDGTTPRWESKAHFFGAAARAMRCILIDRARAVRTTRRRSADPADGTNDTPTPAADVTRAEELLRLDEALDRLRDIDPRQHEVVMLRTFAGLSNDQIADAMGLSLSTVKSEWAYARAWLARQLATASRSPDPAPGSDHAASGHQPGAGR